VSPAGELRQNAFLFEGGKAVLGFQYTQQFQRPQIRLDSGKLAGGNEGFIAYSVVSLSLW
jgi:hypothetical protein